MVAVTEALEGEELVQGCIVQGVSGKVRGEPGSCFHNLMIQYFHLKIRKSPLHPVQLRVCILTEPASPPLLNPSGSHPYVHSLGAATKES